MLTRPAHAVQPLRPSPSLPKSSIRTRQPFYRTETRTPYGSPMSQLRVSLLIAGLVAMTLAGCIANDEGVGAEDDLLPAVRDDWWVGVVPSSLIDENHAHNNRSHHAGLSTENFEVLGWDPLVTDFHDSTVTGMGCGGAETREDGRRLAVVHSISTVTSFVVADVTDPEAPFMVGEFYLPNAVVWDATITADGMHVVIGAYPPGPLFGRDVTLPVGADPADQDLLGLDPETEAYDHHGNLITAAQLEPPAWATGIDSMIAFRDACSGRVVETGPQNYLPGPAIVMAGLQTPEDPVFEDYVPQPVIGPHSVGSQMIDGVVYATSSVTNLAHEGSYYSFFEITDTPAGSKLAPLTVLRTPGAATADWAAEGRVFLNGHTDVYIHKHPFTDQVLAYLANWDGMYVYDITTPQAPMQIGVFRDGLAGSIHTTYPFPYVSDDKFYMIAAQEVGEPAELPSGWVYILDITDPATPTEVGRWTLPVKPKWDNGGLQFSPHYVGILEETLFVTNYHGGMWAVDITDLTNPQAIGIFVPENPSPKTYRGNEYGPSIGDVIVDQETQLVTTWDNAGGVYQLRWLPEVTTERAPHYDPEAIGDA